MTFGEMGDVVRSKFGLDPEVAEAAVWTRQLGDLNERINKLDTSIGALVEDLPGAVIRSVDAGATPRCKLAALRSEREGLVTAAEAIRKTIAEVLAVERAAELQARWDSSRKFGDAFVAAATRADAAISAAAAMVAPAVWELKAAESVFELSLPSRPDRPWGYASQRPTARDAKAIALDAIGAHVQNDGSIEKVPALKALAESQLDARFVQRASTAKQITTASNADEQHDRQPSAQSTVAGPQSAQE